MCASGVGRKFEVKWNGVGELDLSEILKAKKRVIFVSTFEKKRFGGGLRNPLQKPRSRRLCVPGVNSVSLL